MTQDRRDYLLSAIEEGLMYRRAPRLCEACADSNGPCQKYNECECERVPACHDVRRGYTDSARDAAMKAVAILWEELAP